VRTPTAFASRLRALAAFPPTMPTFDRTSVPANPTILFAEWLETAIELGDPAPNATTLVTVGDDVPTARVVTLRDIDENGWHLATRLNGRASQAMRSDSRVALLWYWNRLGRQVRLTGQAAEGDRADAIADYRRRPSAQNDFESEALDWTTWVVSPQTVEFWQASEDRVHLRLEYQRAGGGWSTHAFEGL
jgi:pyridoxamine 5'-phosphate oxidase